MPLSTDVLSGERADDGLYLAAIERLRTGLKTTGLLFVGDCKMRALETRASLARHHDFSLSPLPLTGATAEAMDAWISAGVTQGEAGEFAQIFRTNDRGHEVLAAEAYECARCCGAQGSQEGWTERVVMGRSPRHAHHQAAGLDKRLTHAETALAALTPPRGRGKRQSTDEATRVEAIALVLKDPRVEGLLRMAWEKQSERHPQSVGRGRGSVRRPTRGIKTTRSHITRIARQEDNIAALRPRCGWKAFGTKAGHKRRSLQEAVWCSRNAYRVERVFNRLKSRVPIAPLFVKRNDHIEGLTSLLTLGVRV
jgi:transposase